MDYEYEVVLSFAGEDRDYVKKASSYLKRKGVKFFYDDYEKVKLWGKDLYVHLDEIYRKKAKFCVMFLSKYYAEKVWTNHERQSAQARAFQEMGEYVLPARFDDTEIPGIKPTTGYIDLKQYTPEEFAELIIEKIHSTVNSSREVNTSGFRKPKVNKIEFNPYDEAQNFITYISSKIKKRCDSTGISCSTFNRDGRTCIRIVSSGEVKYSLDIWIGGITGDSGISFYGVEGEPRFSPGSTNAWGELVWDKNRERIALDFHDMSLIDILSGNKMYSQEEFSEALWNKICNAIEGR